MIKRQDYSTENGAAFREAYSSFGMPVLFDDIKITTQFVELINGTINNMAWNKQDWKYNKIDKYTLVGDSNYNYSIYAAGTLLAKIRDGKLVHLWLPSWTKFVCTRNHGAIYDYSAFFKGAGTRDLVKAGFPDLVRGGDDFLREARNLERLFVPNMKTSGKCTLMNSNIERLDFPSATKFGKWSFTNDENLLVFNGPKLTVVGDWFAYGCRKLSNDGLNTPMLQKAGKICHPLIYDVIQKNQENHK